MQKKIYTKPEFRTAAIQLGVFGDYSGGNGPGGQDDNRPVKITNPFAYTIE